MDALILASDRPEATARLAWPVAGAPLLVRQLEWLQACGVKRVAINRVSAEPLPKELNAAVLERTGLKVVWIPTGEPLDATNLALRLGVEQYPILVLPPGLVGNVALGDLALEARNNGQGAVVGTGSVAVEVRVGPAPQTPENHVEPDGWMESISDEASLQKLTESVLRGECKGIQIRGSEISPGIWRARGAVVVQGAQLEPPVYLGADCFLAEDSRIGPGAVIGENAIIESGAHIRHARVAPGVIVGQRVSVVDACALPGQIVRHSGRAVPIPDRLLVDQPTDNRLATRAMAGLAMAAVAPIAPFLGAPALRAVRRLARVIEGRGQWIGTRQDDADDSVVIDVLPLLVPPEAQEEELAAARALYGRTKSLRGDARLLAGLILGASSTEEPAHE